MYNIEIRSSWTVIHWSAPKRSACNIFVGLFLPWESSTRWRIWNQISNF